MPGNRRVRAHRNTHARFVSPGDIFAVDIGDFAALADGPFGRLLGALGRLQRCQVNRQRRDEERAALQHQLDGLVVYVGPVLDGVKAGTHRVLDAIRPVGMGHHLGAVAVGGLLRDHRQFRGRELRMRRLGRGAVHATGRGDLHHVGAGAQDFPHLGAHLLHPITQSGRSPRIGRIPQLQAGRQPAVTVPPGGREHRDGDLEPRPHDQPRLDRLLDPEIGASRVAHAGHAGLDRAAQALHHQIEVEGERRAQQLLHAGAFGHQMDVRVNEAREDVAAGGVKLRDRVVRDGNRVGCTDGVNTAVFEQHGGVLDRRCAGTVNERTVSDQGVGHTQRSPLPVGASYHRHAPPARSALKPPLAPSLALPRSTLQGREETVLLRTGGS